MKISAYHKSKGDDVVLKTNYDNLQEFDRVKISKVYTDTPIQDYIIKLPNVDYGGTGFFFDKAPPLPDEIEHMKPDYHLYDDWVEANINNGIKAKEFAYFKDYSLGFMTRGCIRQCSFCVNKNYTKASLHSPVEEFLDKSKKYICLLDDNVFACQDWKNVFEQLHKTGKRFQFKQGMDERLLTDEKCDALFNKSKWIGDYIFAFDNIKDANIIENKLKLIRKYTGKVPKFYVFCGFNHDNPDHYDEAFWIKDIYDLFIRIQILMKYRCLPYIMRYKDYVESPFRGLYINLARWCNQPSFFKKKSFREFCIANGLNSSCYRYLIEFEKEHPDIKPYFDMKFAQ